MTKLAKLSTDILKEKVKKEEYYSYHDKVVICLLHVDTGLEHDYIVVGQSGTIDPERFDFNIGKDIAYSRAMDRLWQLEGFRACHKEYYEQE